jgi:hypothetical protein
MSGRRPSDLEAPESAVGRVNLCGLGPCDIGPGKLHPFCGVGVTDEVEEPAENRYTVAPAEPEASRVRRKSPSELARVVVNVVKRLRHDTRDGLRLLIVSEEIRSDLRRPGNRKAPEVDPTQLCGRALVEPDIRTAGLTPARKGELVAIGGKVADAVERRRGPVRDDPLDGRSFPCGDSWCELEPCGPEIEMVGDRCPGEAVDPVGYSLKEAARRREAIERRLGDLGEISSLPTGDETPLILGDLGQALLVEFSYHYCNIPHFWGVLQHLY